ncbi:MAG: surface antigen family protein [Rhodocyclaceae bacterium]|nr:MAG: surface antigen family protein [Rhodocyclaceae bacterium]TND01072.1 MAG: surface antigen family protein [Rhodocyclaceae bacterium]
METTLPATSSSSLHPVLWIAGISVTLLSLAGVAALTGLLPAKTAPVSQPPAIVAAAPVTAPVPVAAPTAPAAAAPAPVVAANKTVAVSHQKTAKRKVEEVTLATPVPEQYRVAGGVPPDYAPPPVVASTPPPCLDCGVVANVRQVTHEAKPSGAGAVIGGLAGAVLGSNIGRGNTRTVASIAGAIGGGLLGNTIEKSRSQTTSYEVSLRMDDGSTRAIAADTLPSWRIGDKVKLVSGAIVSR